MEVSTAVSAEASHTELPRSIGETAETVRSPSTSSANDVMETSSIATQQELHKPQEDGTESDKARTDSDDEEDVEQHQTKQDQVPSMSVVTLRTEPTTPQDENREPMTLFEQPSKQNFEDKDASVVTHESIEKKSEKEVEVQEESTQEKVAELDQEAQSPPSMAAAMTVTAEKVEMYGNEIELKVQDEELKVMGDVEDDVELEVHDEVEHKVQDEVKLKVQDKLEPLKLQDEEPMIQDEVELKVQSLETQNREVELKVQDEVELQVQDEVELQVQDKVQLKVQEEVELQVQEEAELQVQDEMDEVKLKVQSETQNHEVKLKVQDEVKVQVQDEVELKAQDKVELKLQNEMEIKVQDELELKLQDEMDEMELKVQSETQNHEVELKVQDEVKLQVQDEVELQVHDEVELKVQDEVELQVQSMEAQSHEVELVIPSPKPSTSLNTVHYDNGDEASSSEEEEVAASEVEEEGADLGTPLGYGGAADFDERQADFASHRFLGPSVAADPASARALHSLRCVALHDTPPRFVSEAPVIAARPGSLTSSGGSSGRNSSSASVIHAPDDKFEMRSQSEAGFVESLLNTYTLSFTESVLGFDTNVVMSLENELLVEVWSVEKDSPAQRGGVVVGDNLISVNGQHIEAHMTKEQVLEMIETSAIPRTLVFQRDMHDKEAAQSKSLSDKKLSTAKPLIGRLGAAMSQGASIIGFKWKRKKTIVHPNSFCDGCGMDPITGALWTCSVCSNYNLCSECYDAGTHGMENSEQMQALNEAIVQYQLQKKCKHFTPEFFLSLRRDICKGRPDKFEYLGEWIANIVVGTSAAKITVRGIEIPSLPPAARQRFVSYLMPLVSNRTDIEVNIEWLPDDADQTGAGDRPSVDRMSPGAFGSDEEDEEGAANVPDNLEKLRIWISDKKTRITSPFA